MILLRNYRTYLDFPSTVLYGFCVTSNFSVTVVLNEEGRCNFFSVTICFVCK